MQLVDEGVSFIAPDVYDVRKRITLYLLEVLKRYIERQGERR